MEFNETQTAKQKRFTAGWIFLGIGLLMLLGGLVLFDGGGSGFEGLINGSTKIMAIGFGGWAALMGVLGLLAKPHLVVDGAGVKISGFVLPNANLDVKWEEISGAKVTTNSVQARVLWLTPKTGSVRLIEDFRYENFQQMLDLAQKNLAEKGITIEFTELPAPVKK